MSRPGVFGRLLLESPSVAVGNGVLLERARHFSSWPQRIVLGVGGNERRGIDNVNELASILRSAGLSDDRLKVVVQEDAGHNEAAWASRFPDALAFLFGSP
jgi:predicted alpha/beta superfamily hydrolase